MPTWKLILAALPILAVAAGPESAHAESASPEPSDVSLAANLGYGHPGGIVGGSVAYHGLEPMQLALLVGATGEGLHIGLTPRLLIGPWKFRPLVAAGPTVGFSPRGTLVWLHWEAGFERRWSGGTYFSLAVGERYLASGTIERGCPFLCWFDDGVSEYGPGWKAASIRLTVGKRL